MKVYLITEQEMQKLREQLELEHMRKANVLGKSPDLQGEPVNDIWRAYNFVVCRWMAEVGR